MDFNFYIKECHCKKEERREGHFDFKVGRPIKKRSPIMLSITSDNTQKINVTINPVQKSGDPVPVVSGIPTWSVVSGTATLIPSADGLNCDFVSQDAVDADPANNVTVVSVNAHINFGTGAGIEFVSDTVEYSVTDSGIPTGESRLGLQASAPVPK